MKHWMIADSGGTGTTWVWGASRELGRMETASLHPRNISDFPERDRMRLLALTKEILFESVDFYGAGMSVDESKKRIIDLLEGELSFTNVCVKTDAVAAGLACCAFDHGFAAILGTGSILIEMNSGELISRRGGLGPEKGDEGSAFYFGKLFLEAVRQGEFKPEVESRFGSVEQFIRDYTDCNPTYLAGLAKLTAQFEVAELHRENVRRFIETHLLVENLKLKELGVIGSYGFHISTILREELAKEGVLLNRVFAKPLDNLVALKIKNNIR